MRIAIAQVDTIVGDLVGNSRKVLAGIRRAEEAGAELVVFPEMVLCGYPALDLLERDDFVAHTGDALRKVAAACGQCCALVGHVSVNHGPSGRRLHNSVSLCGEGRVLATVHKTLLPTYDVFDEARFFEPAPARGLVHWRGRALGLTVCEDLWAAHGLPERRPYATDPVAELLAQGPDLLLNVSASPFHLGKPRERLAIMGEQARRAGVPLVYCNSVGGNDGVIFDGNSMVFDGEGTLLRCLAGFAEDFAVVELPEGDAPAALPCDPPAPLLPEEEAYRALCLGLQDYARKTGFQRAVLGVSGGIDSALVATLAADALGAERVLGVSMPSAISSEHSRSDARDLARNLGIELVEVPIAAGFEAYRAMLGPHFAGLPDDVTEENLQARIRGNILMAFSNKLGHLVLNTGNKSEMAVGYCTLYGDMAGGLAVLADVPKTLVYRMARWLNRAGERIPENTIEKPPSAELRPGQVDQDNLPPYDILDAILRAYVEEHRSISEILAAGLPEDAVRKVVGMINRQEYKRRQTPPVLKVTTRAFGTGRRYPVVQRYDPFHGAEETV